MSDELARLQALREYQILDTPPETAYDDLVRLAAHLCAAPIAALALVDADRQWFKAHVGMPAREAPRADAFCAYTIQGDEPFIVEDAGADPRFAASRLVVGAPHIRFYAGVPLVTPEGARLGALAVMDCVPRRLGATELQLLQRLARQAMAQLELRLERSRHRLTAEHLDATQRVGEMGSWELLVETNTLSLSDGVYRICGIERGQLPNTLDSLINLVPAEERPALFAAQERALRGGGPLEAVHRILRPDGTVRYVRERARLLQEHGRTMLVGTMQDITAEQEAERERLEQQRALREALETLSFHLHNSPLAVIEWDHEGRVVHWSPQAAAIFGWSEAEVLGLRPPDWPLVHPDDADAVGEIIGVLLSGAAPRLISQNRNLARDGSVLHCEWYNSVRRDEAGRPVSIFSLVHDVTRRVETEQANLELLRREQAARIEAEEARRYFRSLFEAAPGLYLVLEPNEYRVVAASEAFLSATMTRREELVGRQLFEVFPADPADPEADGMRNMLASLQRVRELGRADVMAVQRYPVRRPAEEGGGFEERYWSPLNSPVYGPDGELAYIIHRVEDVTEFVRYKERIGEAADGLQTLETRREQMEADIVLRSHQLQHLNEQLRASEARFRRLFNDAATGLVITSTDGGIIEANPAFSRMLGYSGAELAGRSWPTLLHPDDRAHSERLIAELLARARGSFVAELRLIAREDNVVWSRISASAPRDTAGEVLNLIFITEDISQQREAEAQLAESEERFRLIAQATVDTIWDWNLETDEGWWSSGLQTMFGYSPDKFERDVSGWSSRIHPADAPQVLESVYQVIQGRANEWERRYRFRRSDGSYAEVSDRGFVIRDEQGRAVRMVGGMTDITERLALEAQLRQVQRLEAVGQLTGGVAHDFNNLLTVILGNAELLADELAGAPELHALAESVVGAAHRGAELTRRLLAFARRQPLDPKVVDLNRLVVGMDDLLRRTIGEHIEIELALAAGLWPALVDPVQLESALLNLCINARDAMAGGGRLTIETANTHLGEAHAGQQPDVQPGEYLLLAVSDTGTGIAPEHLPQVFEPFFTTKPKGKGTGLGLSMVYGFIKQSRGHISIASEPGQGTTVRLYLPRVAGHAAPEAEGLPAGERAGGSESILLVEDDELVRQYAHQQLVALGYQVLTAANGPEALAIIREREEIALLFTDIVMPGGMSGRELAAAARALRPQLKVLYTSGYSELTSFHHERGEPEIHLLSKPYLRAELARKVREALAVAPP